MQFNKANELYILKGRKSRKFCRVCAFSLIGEKAVIERHYEFHHEEFETPEFLQKDQEPLDPCYKNWPKYKDDPENVELELLTPKKKVIYTRKRKEKQEKKDSYKKIANNQNKYEDIDIGELSKRA